MRPLVRSRSGRQRLATETVVELVRSAAAGDRRGWDELVREFSGLVWGVARAHRLSDADVGDVAQATWLRLLEHIHRVKEPAHIGAWLVTTARRESLRTLRHAQRQVLLGDEELYDDCSEAPAHQLLVLEERDRALWRSFSRLRASDRALLSLLMAEPRMPYDEISAALVIPIGSIGPTRARALGRLRQELEDDGALALVSTDEGA
ncbi:MAG: sigma-70 family RNA polymerase sigma factor [Solirubrobacterales bacterium]|nr:sigma-70 family RNA polymerase sigma factor [Solirubrobacterales bacterium]MBV9713802.1 sigma-70 family RNA polymerase sigma factor [Solirubrobacterales bacterium]